MSKNALKHGLSLPVRLAAGADARLEEMAQAITGSNVDPIVRELARRIAEAQLDVLRVRQARRTLLSEPETGGETQNPSGVGAPVAGARHPSSMAEYGERDVAQMIEASNVSRDPQSLAEHVNSVALRLAGLDRYERRAFARRKFAMRDFDAYCAERFERDRSS
ncbi:hypothetical protein [Methylocystis echinoides]|uniref:Uncharacterized protein n=1 Tax=Methylocystis echinoides TaxID=29468 RepID=A0A9W6GQN1_9HYPH|nr:hypothetical protein [Methylocystis echinoides]GLI91110.1 hypothetical protein LMG27198_01020 [Methylocystis echinoides]